MSGQTRNDGSGREAQPVAATWDLAVARQLVGCAARKAPLGLAERLEEEWLADLIARQGALARIRFGLGCCWATRVIAREFGAAAAASSAASGQQLLVAHGGVDFSGISRRTVAMIAIVCLHVAVFYAYLSGFTQRIISPPAGRIHVIMTPRASKPLPLPPPRLAPATPEPLPTPLAPWRLPAMPMIITVPQPPRHNIAPAQPPIPKSVSRVTGGPGVGFPDTGDYYPPAARRLGEAGNTVVRACVDPRGRLTAAPTVVHSSGIGLIDEGALRLAAAGSGHYRPTTENGQPVSSCYAFRIRFQLEEQ